MYKQDYCFSTVDKTEQIKAALGDVWPLGDRKTPKQASRKHSHDLSQAYRVVMANDSLSTYISIRHRARWASHKGLTAWESYIGFTEITQSNFASTSSFIVLLSFLAK